MSFVENLFVSEYINFRCISIVNEQNMRALQHNFSKQYHALFLSVSATETTFFLEKRKVMLHCMEPLLKPFAICQIKSYGAEFSVF